MNLKNKVIPISDFQYSVNIDYDLNSDEKIRGYIPTVGGINIIEDILLSVVPSSKDRARLLVGAYGKGKSHLVLTVLSLLNKKDKSLFTAVLNKAKEVNPKFHDFLEEYIDSDKKLLPVVIQGSNTDVNQTFLLSLKTALEVNGLNSVLPDSYFNSAIDMIDVWKNNYKNTYKTLQEKLQEPIAEFVFKLNQFDSAAYQKFITIYPELTSGGEFSPSKGLDIPKVYEDVSKKIKSHGYNGIFVVYDEFSKFLENSIGNTSAMEIKMIQDFAEMCARSADNQMHLLLISHKHIQNYISQLPKEKVDAWKAVSERFKTVEINNNFTQTYEIISTVIKKDDKWYKEFQAEHKDDFMLLQESMDRINTFSDLPSEVRYPLIHRTYPLDPASLYILPRISELVAQNERTIFTFLASNQKNSLTDFINNVDEAFPLITPDYIYDYFEQLFKNEDYRGEIYKIWNLCNIALLKLESKTNNPLAYKILKTVALIWILQKQDNRLTPTTEVITNIFREKYKNINEIDTAFRELKQNGVISILEYNGYISIVQGSGIDIQKQIDDNVIRLKFSFDSKEELNKLIKDSYLYPLRYNYENAINRYFKVEFIKAEEILEVRNWEKKIASINADGVVYLVLENGTTPKTTLNEAILNIDNEQVVFVRLTKQEKIEKTLLKIKALNAILDNAKDNEKRLLKEELSVYFDDCLKIVNEFMDYYLRPELQKSIYVNNGIERKKLKRKSNVSQLLSEICEHVFTKTPTINNELINKNEISTPLFNARTKVLSALLQNELNENLGFTGSGPEVNIVRSTLFAFGILEQDGTNIKIDGLENKNIQNILDICKEFFISSGNGNGQCFGILYETLTKPNFNIGLKKGVIPIYIAVLLHIYKQHAVVMNMTGKEVEITATNLENINKNPNNFKLILEDWNEEKQEYINVLDDLFRNQVSTSEKEYNTFDYIVKAMQRWFQQLPKFTKECEQQYLGDGKFEKIDIKAKKLKAQLRSGNLNSREFLFDKIPEIYGKNFDKLLFNALKKTKTLFDDFLTNICESLVQDIKKIYNGKENATLVSTLKDWVEGLKHETKSHLFEQGNEVLFSYIENANNNDYEILEKIARHLTGLRISDWEDETIVKFIDSITIFKNVVEEQNSNSSNNQVSNTGLYKISYIDDDGKEEVKTLTKIETSKKANLLNNDIVSLLEDFGEAITTNEKRQVLLDILQKLK